jgi:hypothetical protein
MRDQMAAATEVVNTLEKVVDLSNKLVAAADPLNNVRMLFENRSTKHVGTFLTPEGDTQQDWELVTPYLGSTALNQRTGIYEPSTAVSVTDVVDKQRLTLSLFVINDKGTVLAHAARVDVYLESSAGMHHATIRVTVTTIDEDGTERVLLDHSSDTSFSQTVWDWGKGPLGFSVGWAHNKYILQVTVLNLNILF